MEVAAGGEVTIKMGEETLTVIWQQSQRSCGSLRAFADLGALTCASPEREGPGRDQVSHGCHGATTPPVRQSCAVWLDGLRGRQALGQCRSKSVR
jgi:hypothetical protein